jgi:hypothetical protein
MHWHDGDIHTYTCFVQARWSEMFPCIVARASTTDIISSGMGGTRSGSIQLVS